MSEIQGLLEETSRTFALSIPLLPEPLLGRVSVAYLLFRIADTLEDETSIPASDRALALRTVADAADNPGAFSGSLSALLGGLEISTDHDGYDRLMRHAGPVLAAFDELDAEAKGTVALHLGRTCRGMSEHVAAGSHPENLEQLRAYCYTVAGIVGDLLTELFVSAIPMKDDAHQRLAELAPLFGEALQLVNILRDEHDDARSDRRYVPVGAERAPLVALAASDLRAAGEYIRLLETHGADPGIVAFNGVNAMLAVETLALVAIHGPGVKLERPEVRKLVSDVRKGSMDPESSVGSMVIAALDAACLDADTGVSAGDRPRG
ncbi:MAG: squalene/phytoene synthase family protein [Planctomycetota bacterium]